MEQTKDLISYNAMSNKNDQKQKELHWGLGKLFFAFRVVCDCTDFRSVLSWPTLLGSGILELVHETVERLFCWFDLVVSACWIISKTLVVTTGFCFVDIASLPSNASLSSNSDIDGVGVWCIDSLCWDAMTSGSFLFAVTDLFFRLKSKITGYNNKNTKSYCINS